MNYRQQPMEDEEMSDVLRKFASVAAPEKYGYAYDSDSWRRTSDSYPVETKFRMFETFGDGLTQHSGDWAVTYEYLADYLISLGVFMVANRDDEELYDGITYIILQAPRLKLIQFAATVIWNEKDEPYGKTRYYSLTEEKITRNQDKRHDKRYREIDKGCTGSAQSIYNILMADKEYADGMGRLCCAFAIKKFVDEQPHGSCEHPTVMLGWWKDDAKATSKRTALGYGFRAVQALALSYRELKQAECEIGNYQRNCVERAAEKVLALTAGEDNAVA